MKKQIFNPEAAQTENVFVVLRLNIFYKRFGKQAECRGNKRGCKGDRELMKYSAVRIKPEYDKRNRENHQHHKKSKASEKVILTYNVDKATFFRIMTIINGVDTLAAAVFLVKNFIKILFIKQIQMCEIC